MITLLSDFGMKDASVAIAKGILLQHVGKTQIIDISHEVTPYHLGEAAYLLAGAYSNFPEGTVHIVLFDLFSEPNSRLVLFSHASQFFLCPDNGLIPQAIGVIPDCWKCFDLKSPDGFTHWLHQSARVAERLKLEQPHSLGFPKITPKKAPLKYQPENDGKTWSLDVIHIDQYDNTVVNFTKNQFEASGRNRSFTLQFMLTEEINSLTENYTDVREGYKLCRFNSNGNLEICINHGKAASLFGFRIGGNNNIKLRFE